MVNMAIDESYKRQKIEVELNNLIYQYQFSRGEIYCIHDTWNDIETTRLVLRYAVHYGNVYEPIHMIDSMYSTLDVFNQRAIAELKLLLISMGCSVNVFDFILDLDI